MREFTIHAQYDEEARVWWASNDQLPLTTEAATLDELLSRVTDIAAEIAAKNGLIEAGEQVKIHLVADKESAAAV